VGYTVESFIFGSKHVVISKLSSFQEKNYCIAENLAGIKFGDFNQNTIIIF